jgi:hypothetical protein
MQHVSRLPVGKHVRAATNTHITIGLLLETVFPTRSVQSGYKEDNWGPLRVEFCMEDCEDTTWEREAEEFPLLEVVAREQLLKTQHA